MGHPASQQQAMGARHEHHLYLHSRARGDVLGLGEFDAPFGDDHCLRLADFTDQGLRNHGAEQVQAFVLGAQEGGQGAVLLAQLAQQVLGLEVGQVQFAEQVEQRGLILQQFCLKGFGRAQGTDFQCDPVFDAVVFAAIFFV